MEYTVDLYCAVVGKEVTIMRKRTEHRESNSGMRGIDFIHDRPTGPGCSEKRHCGSWTSDACVAFPRNSSGSDS